MLYEVAIIETTKGIVGDTAKGVLAQPAMPTGRFNVTQEVATDQETAKALATVKSKIMQELATSGNAVVVKVRAF